MPPTKKKKILHTMTWLAPGGGADNNVFHTLNCLQEEYEMHLVTGQEIHHNPFQHLAQIRFFVCEDLVRPIRPLRDLKALWWLYRHIRREGYDIVHTHETKSSFLAKIAAWFAGVPYIIYGLHGVAFNDPLSRMRRLLYILLERLTIWTSDLIVSVSQSCIAEYHAHNIGRAIPYEIAYSGIDAQYFIQNSEAARANRAAGRARLGFAPDDFVLINIGRFSYAKAQRYTIAAFAQLKQRYSNLKLLLVGEGPLMEECQAQAEALGVRDSIVFYGFADDIPGVLALADIHVLTSLREGLPRVVVEASLCGLPTAAFEVEGIHEILREGEWGFVVPQYDSQALADRIAQLLDAPDLGHRFGERARRHAEQRWDYPVMVDQLRRLYEQGPAAALAPAAVQEPAHIRSQA